MLISSAGEVTSRFIRSGHSCSGIFTGGQVALVAEGHHGTPLWSRLSDTSTGQLHAWTAWGIGRTPGRLPGFNGERTDTLNGCYPLGNGYRAYSPLLSRFCCPDSPEFFARGDINPYAYCAGDPLNYTDPTGHLSWRAIAGIVMGSLGLAYSVVTMGMSIAAAGSIMGAISTLTAETVLDAGIVWTSNIAKIISGALEERNPRLSVVMNRVSMIGFLRWPGMAKNLLGKMLRSADEVDGMSPGLNFSVNSVQEPMKMVNSTFNLFAAHTVPPFELKSSYADNIVKKWHSPLDAQRSRPASEHNINGYANGRYITPGKIFNGVLPPEQSVSLVAESETRSPHAQKMETGPLFRWLKKQKELTFTVDYMQLPELTTRVEGSQQPESSGHG